MTETGQRLLDLLAELDIQPEILSHPPVRTVEDAEAYWGDIRGQHTKNLFLKDAKGAMFLLTVPADRKVDLKKLPQLLDCKRLSFGSAERMMERLQTIPGSLGPLSMIADTDHQVRFAIDAALLQGDYITMHPMDNTQTFSISPDDLRKFLHALGVEPLVVTFTDEETV
ncbi:prolyl-tRNA synthetase associated domain-containing protein [Komagataeibacter saccharivorans]|uniref:prolyl-tRNA synthetase associated domain-containing protein n=1 Tax=Komagataeibacter saccharivorans TaxID=265959 RepID=UPI0039EAEF39